MRNKAKCKYCKEYFENVYDLQHHEEEKHQHQLIEWNEK